MESRRNVLRANGWDFGRLPGDVRSHWTRLIQEPPENFVRLGAEVEGHLVGYADLADIRQGEAELGIAIGDSVRWGTGLGTAAAVAMLRYGFEKLGLHQIRATTHETNVRSIALLEKLGFRRVGTLPVRVEYMGELTVVPNKVADTSDGWAGDGGVVSVMVVDVEPSGKCSHSLTF